MVKLGIYQHIFIPTTQWREFTGKKDNRQNFFDYSRQFSQFS